MFKKLTLLAMVVGAFAAFAIPAAASAAPAVTVGGALVKTPATLTATSSNAETTGTPLGTLTCTNVTVSGILDENTGSKVHAKTDGAGSTSGCKAGGTSVTINDPTLTTLVSTTSGSGTVSLAFGASFCSYTGSPGFTYVPGSDSIHINGTISSPLCGSATFHGDFTITIGGVAVVLD